MIPQDDIINIEKLIIEVEINEQPGTCISPFQLQDLVREEIIPKIISSLEDTLKRTCGSYNEIFMLDKLEIDLGVIDESEIDNALPDRVRGAFAEFLGRTVSAKIKNDEVFRHVSRANKTIESFHYYLKNGNLPWWDTIKPFGQFEKDVVEAILSNPLPLPDEKTARRRFATNFSREVFIKIIEVLDPGLLKSIDILEHELELFFKYGAFPESKKKKIIDLFKNGVMSYFVEKPSSDIIEFIISGLDHEQLSFLRYSLPEKAWIRGEATRRSRISDLVLRKAENRSLTRTKEFISGNDALEPAGDNEKFRNTKDNIYVSNAGLVLLHPFLEMFLEAVGLSSNGRLSDPHRSVRLLEFLVTGENEMAEYALPLNKLLCGVPLNEVTEVVFAPRLDERMEVKNLLESAIKHWYSIKNTSVQGLRQSFLMREGILHFSDEDSWHLFVEQKSYDILLDSLPWSISLIRLPWMKNDLYVDWIS